MVIGTLAAAGFAFLVASIFFDQGRLTRKGTLHRLDGDPGRVALTFDDGPDPRWTPQILDVLARHGARATFFLIGRQAERHPDLVRRIAAEGHGIGNHTHSHVPLWRLAHRAALRDIDRAGAAIAAACGRRPTLFRPPKGLFWPAQKRWVAEAGLRLVMWSVNAKDWAGFSAARTAASLRRRVGSGDIVLLHDGGGALASRGGDRSATVAALDRLLDDLRSRGLETVTLEGAS